MARNRMSSLFERWSHTPRAPASPTTDSHSAAPPSSRPKGVLAKEPPRSPGASPPNPSAAANIDRAPINTDSPSPPRNRSGTTGSRSSSRPPSMVQTYQPPLMEVANDTPPELQPIFTFLNSHSNKLYQEGYFLKLHDLDTRGRPSKDRAWQECFAQLVGTVLSLWDAAELDAAGEDGEVVPTFINLADASIKMIESLPMNEGQGSQLQNVLSISTAANNRYLLHFNSLNSLTQWTAGIRLAMYEYATLQEAYTGSLVAGKGKTLNNIRQILERNRHKHEDWARVRFGAGTPWRRCWFVVSPPDEKEWERAQKMARKNKYSKPPILRGDVKFYETRKVTKRTRPIATITNAYSAYAIYPQSKPLIEQSTLVKIEGRITIHSNPESTTEGFVFVMPEVHPAISGFEMMLRFLFPVWDSFALYGRPQRLIADVLDQRGLMFAMPRDRRYGYLETLDVAGLIHTEGSSNWQERQWRTKMKEMTSKRMLALGDEPRRSPSSRTSMPPGARASMLRFGDSNRTSVNQPRRAESAMAGMMNRDNSIHRRTASDTHGLGPYQGAAPRLNHSTSAINERDDSPPPPPPHSAFASSESVEPGPGFSSGTPSPDRDIPPEVTAMGMRSPPPGPVDAPTFAHAPSEKPRTRPNQAPELRQGYSNLDEETRVQMAEATSAGVRNAPSIPAGPPPPYGQHGNHGYGPGPYLAQNGARGTSPDSRPGPDYRRNAPNAPRLATIPASPFVEQESPVLDRAGQVLVPQTVPENTPATMAATAAMAALAATPSYSKSGTDLRSQAVEQQNNTLQKVGSNGSGNSSSSRNEPSRAFSVQRKPVGAAKPANGGPVQQSQRASKIMQAPAHLPPGVQLKPNHAQYGTQGQAARNTYSPPPSNPQAQPTTGQSPYGQPPAGYQGGYPPAGYQGGYPPAGYQGGYPSQQGQPPPMHGTQMPYRPPVQNTQGGQPQGQGWA